MQETLFGVKIECNIGRFDYASYYNDPELTDSLVQYDPGSNTVTVDSRASEFYAKYAAIHECICCGKYKHLAPPQLNPNGRCAAIDRMLLTDMAPQERKYYLQKRLQMFETLLRMNLNEDLNDMFEASLKELKKLAV